MAVKKYVRIATRKSLLAYWQANAIKKKLEEQYPSIAIELIPLTTEGDKDLESSLSKLGGKGLFVKALEIALLNGEADIAVHSMKDMPTQLEQGLTLAVICEREDARDVLVSNSRETLNQLLIGSRIGSSSLRRQSQLMALRPDLKFQILRGNVDTRLKKLAAGEYDAIILAAAGLIRLEKSTCISEYLETNYFLPAPGQGALGIECRSEDTEIQELLAFLNHLPTYNCVMAERALSRQLGGSCNVPLAAYAEYVPGGLIRLRGLVARPDGSLLINVEKFGTIDEAQKLGIDAAEELMGQGADAILRELL